MSDGFTAVGQAAQAVLARAIENNTLQPDPDPEELARQEQEREQKRRRLTLERLVEVYKIPFKDAILIVEDRLEETKALNCTQRFRAKASYGGVLVLAGTEGVGKTTAASWLVSSGPPLAYPLGPEDSWPNNCKPLFIEACELMTGGLYHTDYDGLRRASVLAIDDAGVEFRDKAGAFTSVFERVFNLRYSGYGWTIITTNLSLEKFKKAYGQRIFSRLQEKNRGFYHINEPSLRTS